MNEKDKIVAGAVVVILLLSTIVFALQSDSDDDDDENGLETDVVLDAAMTYMESPKVVVTAESLYTDLNDGVTNNDPFILDIRGTNDYESGHIPGAYNIPYRDVFCENHIGDVPTDESIVVVCYINNIYKQVV